MVKYCCICKEKWTSDKDISFFSFPKNEDILKEWLRVIPTVKQFRSHLRVCHTHFHKSDYCRISNKLILNKNAIPSIFPQPVLLDITNCSYELTSNSDNESFLRNESMPSLENTKDVSYTPPEEKSIPFLENNINIDDVSYTPPEKKRMEEKEIQASPNVKNVTTQISPRRLKPSMQEEKLKHEIRNLKMRLYRRDIKLSNVTDMLKQLKNVGISIELEEELLKRFSGLKLDILQNEFQNYDKKTRKHYSDKMKMLASTLYFYSPKAYNFLREHLSLPHGATLRKHIAQFSCKAGFLDGVFQFLKKESIDCDYLKDVALIMDSMSIKCNVIYDKNDGMFKGYIDYGSIGKDLKLQYNETDIASEVLVFQIVSYSSKFKIPIAHFFVNKITSDSQSKLLIEAIKKLYDAGVTVRSITCDGAKVNFSTMKNLGCSFTSEIMTTHFKHPCNNCNVYVIFDACHMIKLSRNVFAEKGLSSASGKISFEYVKNLHNQQENIGLKFSNRLSSKHINYHNTKMKVSLAVQVISCSVANAIDYLRNDRCKLFQDSYATTEFIRIIDRLFDLLNSRNSYGSGFKSPLSLSNFNYWNDILNESERYIRNLTCEGKPILEHNRNTFALGFLIDIQSIRKLAIDLLSKTEKPLKFFLTYKTSQDHIELYFCCLRSRGGFNNNPNIQQVLWSVRQLLYKNFVSSSINANCLSDGFNSTPIYEFRSQKRALCEKNLDNNMLHISDDLLQALDNNDLSHYEENILYYITGYIVSNFVKICNCSYCHDILLLSPKARDHEYTVQSNNCASFLTFVTKGRLCFASDVAYDIIKLAEKIFKTELNVGFMGNINLKNRITAIAIKYYLDKISLMFKPLHPITDTSNQWEELHEIQIIKFMIDSFCKVRLNAYAKTSTLQYLGEKANLRQKLHKTILFYHI